MSLQINKCKYTNVNGLTTCDKTRLADKGLFFKTEKDYKELAGKARFGKNLRIKIFYTNEECLVW